MKLLNVSILTISSILAVSSGHAAKEVSNKAVGADVSNLKSTGYIDIERIKRENPVPDVDIAKQQKEASSIVDRIKVSDKQKLPCKRKAVFLYEQEMQ